jgi:uncharacterized Tic20 family protein
MIRYTLPVKKPKVVQMLALIRNMKVTMISIYPLFFSLIAGINYSKGAKYPIKFTLAPRIPM